MGEEAPVEVYDEGFATNPRYKRSPTKAPWAPIWRAVADLVPPDLSVLDLGCGPGHLAELIGERDRYIGIDFSKVAIAMAQERSPWAVWRVDDLRTCEYPDTRVVVCTEALEHITEDLLVLRKVSRGRRVIISVPDKDSRTHVRFFPETQDAVDRFSPLVKFDQAFRVGEHHHILSGVRR